MAPSVIAASLDLARGDGWDVRPRLPNMGERMSDRRTTGRYRLYWINDGGGVDAVAAPIVASNDMAALAQATALADGDRVELWRETRLVARLGPSPLPPTLH